MVTLYSMLTGAFIVTSGMAPIELGTEKQLFLDDYILQASEGLERRVHPAEKAEANPVIEPEVDWEGEWALLYGSVLHDDGKYRMWYLSGLGSKYAETSGLGVSYAESQDGIHWRKPLMDIVTINGRNTNALIRHDMHGTGEGSIPYFYELFGVYKDPAAGDRAKRYVMGFLSLQQDYSGPHEDPFHPGQRRGIGVAHSPDGLHWTLTESFATEAIVDGGAYWMHEPRSGKIVLYGRSQYRVPAVLEAWKDDPWAMEHYWGRATARIKSSDFLDWNYTKPRAAPVVMAAQPSDPPGEGVYSLMVFPYGSQYIGLIQRFHNRPGDVYLDVLLAVSRDSFHFERVSRETPFISCGPIGAWDRFNTSLANNPPVAIGDELRFYYSGRTYRHPPYQGADTGEPGGRIGYAAIKRDRFASLDASFEGGHLLTKPMKVRGSALHLNAASEFGEILVEVIGPGDEILARSEPIAQDALDIEVKWAEGSLRGISEPIRLRIALKNALLFAMWAE